MPRDDMQSIRGVNEEAPIHQDTFSQQVPRRFAAIPWWVLSVLVHGLLLFALSAFLWYRTEIPKDVMYTIRLPPRKPPPPIETVTREIFQSNREINPDLPIVEEAVVVQEPMDRDMEMPDRDLHEVKGTEDAITADLPFEDIGILDTLGVGAVGRMGGSFGFRSGSEKTRRIAEFGGSRASESAVNAGLAWLAGHQDADGRWDSDHFMKHCGPDTCTGTGNEKADAALTALPLLAFLGAGHTHKNGEWQRNVEMGLKRLIAWQRTDGFILAENAERTSVGGVFGHPMASMALVEAYGMTRSPFLLGPGQRAVDAMIKTQRADGGWRWAYKAGDAHKPSYPPLTTWYVMALKSARIAGFHVPDATFFKVKSYIEGHVDPNGNMTKRRDRMTMILVDMLTRQTFVASPQDAALVRSADLIMGRGSGMFHWPEGLTYEELSKKAQGAGKPAIFQGLPRIFDLYYGSLAMFHMGGSYWDFWNRHMRDLLIARQNKRGHRDGSWDPVGFHTFNRSDLGEFSRGGRIFSTTMCILCLEVYYRYLPMYH